ncbi:MAG: Nif11 family protein, partial [Candidatus Binatia bacterium]
MSLRNVMEFWRAVQGDEALQQRLLKIGPSQSDCTLRVAEIAREIDYEVAATEVGEVEAVISFWQTIDRDAALLKQVKEARNGLSEP